MVNLPNRRLTSSAHRQFIWPTSDFSVSGTISLSHPNIFVGKRVLWLGLPVGNNYRLSLIKLLNASCIRQT